MKEYMRAIKFTLFSISAGVIELAVFSLLDAVTPWAYWPCYLAALVLFVGRDTWFELKKRLHL